MSSQANRPEQSYANSTEIRDQRFFFSNGCTLYFTSSPSRFCLLVSNRLDNDEDTEMKERQSLATGTDGEMTTYIIYEYALGNARMRTFFGKRWHNSGQTRKTKLARHE